MNRYSYAGNNPLIYTDPTGHLRLKSIFRGISNAVKKFTDTIVSAAVAFVASGGNPVVAAVAAVTNIGLSHTGEGRKLTNAVAKNVFDNIFGLPPKYAYMASSITLTAAMTWGLTEAYDALGGTTTAPPSGDIESYTAEVAGSTGELTLNTSAIHYEFDAQTIAEWQKANTVLLAENRIIIQLPPGYEPSMMDFVPTPLSVGGSAGKGGKFLYKGLDKLTKELTGKPLRAFIRLETHELPGYRNYGQLKHLNIGDLHIHKFNWYKPWEW